MSFQGLLGYPDNSQQTPWPVGMLFRGCSTFFSVYVPVEPPGRAKVAVTAVWVISGDQGLTDQSARIIRRPPL